MHSFPDMERVLSIAGGKIHPKKLELLKRKLEEVLDKPLSSQIIEDPVVIRFLLAAKLREDGMSAGMIQSFELLFMGIIRRAAVLGLLPAPPEGPWTYEWQSVLNVSSEIRGARATLRSLASWASAHAVSPNNLNTIDLEAWIKDAVMEREELLIVEKVLTSWLVSPMSIRLLHSSQLLERLQKKASKGTVRMN